MRAGGSERHRRLIRREADRDSLHGGSRNGNAGGENSAVVDGGAMARPNTASTIRRIPASQLSFFPPPSRRPGTRAALDDIHNGPNIPSAKSRHSRFATIHSSSAFTPSSTSTSTLATSSSPRTLSSILNAFPITRDTIIARLSFESNSSKSDEQEHELGDVRGSSSTLASRHAHARSNGSMSTTPRPRSRPRPGTPPLEQPTFLPPKTIPIIKNPLTNGRPYSSSSIGTTSTSARTLQSTPHPTFHHPLSSNSPEIPTSYRAHAIRTSQLEPTLDMTLPVLGRSSQRSNRKVVPDVRDVDFGS